MLTSTDRNMTVFKGYPHLRPTSRHLLLGGINLESPFLWQKTDVRHSKWSSDLPATQLEEHETERTMICCLSSFSERTGDDLIHRFLHEAYEDRDDPSVGDEQHARKKQVEKYGKH